MVHLLGHITEIEQLVLQAELGLLDLVSPCDGLQRVDDQPVHAALRRHSLSTKAIRDESRLVRHQHNELVFEELSNFFFRSAACTLAALDLDVELPGLLGVEGASDAPLCWVDA